MGYQFNVYVHFRESPTRQDLFVTSDNSHIVIKLLRPLDISEMNFSWKTPLTDHKH